MSNPHKNTAKSVMGMDKHLSYMFFFSRMNIHVFPAIFVFTERPIPMPSKVSPTRDFERDGLSDPHGPQRGGLAHLHGLRVTDVLPWGTGGGGTAISGVSNVAHVTGGGGAVANCGLVERGYHKKC